MLVAASNADRKRVSDSLSLLICCGYSAGRGRGWTDGVCQGAETPDQQVREVLSVAFSMKTDH